MLLIVADQALKIWIKTSMRIGEAIIIFPDWFQLRFLENNGAAFGMELAGDGVGFDWGKALLSCFRIAMIIALSYYIVKIIRVRQRRWKRTQYAISNAANDYEDRNPDSSSLGYVVALTLIWAGALGNLIDSAIYGVIFSESTPYTVAHLGGSYAAPLMGKVVDMFYFPLFQWNSVPRFLNFLVDSNNYFFGAIFNLADSYISVAVVYILLFKRKAFN